MFFGTRCRQEMDESSKVIPMPPSRVRQSSGPSMLLRGFEVEELGLRPRNGSQEAAIGTSLSLPVLRHNLTFTNDMRPPPSKTSQPGKDHPHPLSQSQISGKGEETRRLRIDLASEAFATSPLFQCAPNNQQPTVTNCVTFHICLLLLSFSLGLAIAKTGIDKGRAYPRLPGRGHSLPPP